jgi:hypothetical protein
LDEAGIGSRIGAGNNAKVGVVACAAGCIRRRKLGAVEEIEELDSELEAEAILFANHDPLECRNVEIIYPVGA